MTTVEPIRNKKDIERVSAYLQKYNYRDYVLFCLGINSGLRISDILKLNVGDVKDKNYVELTEKKTNKFKILPLNKKLKYIFKSYTLARHKKEPLFLSKRGKRLDRVSAYRSLKSACINLGIKLHIGTHTLRKTFGYHHYKMFKDVAMLQKIFNHSSPDTTLRYIGIEQDIISNSYKKLIL